MPWRAYALIRVRGAVLDALQLEAPKGYRRSWRARNPGAAVPATASLDGTLFPADELPVGWEAEYQDEVEGLARRLPGFCRAIFRSLYGHAGGHTVARAARAAGRPGAGVTALAS